MIDTPYTLTAPLQQSPPQRKTLETFAIPSLDDARDRHDQQFCERCLTNQRIYMESLSKYLPDEDHPRYQEYEDALPKFKQDLEKRYPQVCKVCAPKAQNRIHQADMFGKRQQMDIMARDSQDRMKRASSPSSARERDDWSKWVLRLVLRIVGMTVYMSLLIQMGWHAYGIVTTFRATRRTDAIHQQDDFMTDFVFEPTFKECVGMCYFLHFDLSCFQHFSRVVSKALIVSLCLLWYHHGIKYWFHHTHRIEAVHGQSEHLWIQIIVLAIRTIAWFRLSDDSYTAGLTTPQLLGAHGLMILFLPLAQRVSERLIKAERWTMQGKIMPRAEWRDVFSETAGPAIERYDRQASSLPPVRLFPRDDTPLSISNLAPRRPESRGFGAFTSAYAPPPSPPDSQSVSDDDEMDIDSTPHARSHMPGAPVDRRFRPSTAQAKRPLVRSTYNYQYTQPTGWGAVRNELFDIDDSTRVAEERKRQADEERAKLRYQPAPADPNPFRGRLPPAPMSMERRLRNPPAQVQFKKQPLSQQQDFMKQMRDSVEKGKGYSTKKGTTTVPNKQGARFQNDSGGMESSEDEYSPAKSRTKGQLELHDSGWRLKSDLAKPTGLEDLFGGQSFSIADEPGIKIVAVPRRSVDVPWKSVVGVGLLAVLVAAWNIPPVRRTVCLWLVQQLERGGY